jgi:hypothetical protein
MPSRSAKGSDLREEVARVSNIVRITFNGVYGMMAVPPCPHEGCGWFMPELSCPEHGNYDMTFLSVRKGPLTHVKAVLGMPRPPLPRFTVPRTANCESGALHG